MSLNPNAFTGGVQAGDNWTLDSNLGQFVYGLALDFGSFAMSKTNTAADRSNKFYHGEMTDLS